MSENLKPCPFCGGEAAFGTNSVTGFEYVRCSVCKARTWSGFKTREESIEAWNTRAERNDDVGFVLTGQDVFGLYCRIPYGHFYERSGDKHLYKCIQRFKSNCYSDVPLTIQTESEPYNHGEVVDCVSVINCGIVEDTVVTVAVSDVEFVKR